MIDPDIRAEILKRLHAAEQEHNVRILYACESGSRAWGFASPDSDYDVRFIYAHPQEWYLSFDVESRRDVIEYPIVDEIDCSGWDVRKAMYLFTRTNGALLEWLVSPVRYIEKLESPPPIEFQVLVDAVAPDSIVPGISALLEAKRKTLEKGLGEPIPEINAFIEAETERHGENFSGQGRPDLEAGDSARDELNAIFREVIV